MPGKRKKVVVSVAKKLEAIRRLDKGEIIRNVAADYGVGETTVGDWRRNRSHLEQCATISGDAMTSRKTIKPAEYNKVDKGLFLWFTQMREKGLPVSGPILQAKAMMLAKQFPDESETFTASCGWLDRWKKRHGIHQLSICGEKLSADEGGLTKFKNEFEKLVAEEGYSRDQIYNCDETGLNFRMMPSKTLASREEAVAPGYKKNKERVSILACSNASGTHKLPLMCIGKSVKPRAIKHIKPEAFPVYYAHQKNAWMSRDLFQKWFLEQFIPLVAKFLKKNGLPRKAILLLDNAPSHPNESILRSEDIIVKFFPPNVTSIGQPMDQGVLETFKRHYRRLLLQEILEKSSAGSTLKDCLRAINIKSVIYWSAQAWDAVQRLTLKRSWAKILSSTDQSDQIADDVDLHSIMKQIPGCEDVDRNNTDEWIHDDDCEQERTDDEIGHLVNSAEENADDIEDSETAETPQVSHEEGLNALEIALKYVEEQPESS
ncbi:jerky protein homolog-like [Diprion similis]|uniref:jerky protein homolog-like n=1 Tax=Diprion similis TaxID=362088 RepID=UPI001EF7ED06|nr:jerky protein homolog-like [Diprion similis]